MKRVSYSFFISILFLLSFTVCTWAADYSSTVMTGHGATKDAAIQDAIRNAVESATGVFVYSTSEVKDFKLVKDQIVTASKGYVKDFKVLSESKNDGVVFVKLNVSVDTAAIKSVIKRDIKTTTYEDALKDYATISSIVERNKKYAEILKSISSRPLNELYHVNFTGYEIDNAGTSSVDITLNFDIAQNTFLWNTYYETLRLISADQRLTSNYIITNYKIKKVYDDNGNDLKSFVVRGEKLYLHKDFNNFIIKPRNVALTYKMPEGQLSLKPFLLYDKYFDQYNGQTIPLEITRFTKIAGNITSYIGDNGYTFIISHTLKNVDDIKKLSSIKVSLRDVTKKNITYKWN